MKQQISFRVTALLLLLLTLACSEEWRTERAVGGFDPIVGQYLIEASEGNVTALLRMSTDSSVYAWLLMVRQSKPDLLDSAIHARQLAWGFSTEDTAGLAYTLPTRSCEVGPPKDEIQFLLIRRDSVWLFARAHSTPC